MSENREDEAQEGGERIEELPASDSDVAGEGEGGSSSLRSPGDEPVDSDPDEGGELRSPPPPDPGE